MYLKGTWLTQARQNEWRPTYSVWFSKPHSPSAPMAISRSFKRRRSSSASWGEGCRQKGAWNLPSPHEASEIGRLPPQAHTMDRKPRCFPGSSHLCVVNSDLVIKSISYVAATGFVQDPNPLSPETPTTLFARQLQGDGLRMWWPSSF